jgi:hypothetical protein
MEDVTFLLFELIMPQHVTLTLSIGNSQEGITKAKIKLGASCCKAFSWIISRSYKMVRKAIFASLSGQP